MNSAAPSAEGGFEGFERARQIQFQSRGCPRDSTGDRQIRPPDKEKHPHGVMARRGLSGYPSFGRARLTRDSNCTVPTMCELNPSRL